MLVRTIVAALLAAVLGGCASTSEIEDQARTHALRSQQAAARGDYELAAREKDEADNLHKKAVKHAYKHGETENVTVPASVPAPPAGY